ncbi:protein AF-10-like isoform X4 [Procambarus clarkii]|uniref:protein AF-10 isoform X4 n=1 Tax=Procambarus clarkii TaxID=6728 RepID=UPI001E678E43|nr:protein AF-10-like isoform X4 [Procambarus clarkii]
MKPKQEDPKEMVGGCCVCSDENGWTENPLVYCDGQGCNVAVHQAACGLRVACRPRRPADNCSTSASVAETGHVGSSVLSRTADIRPGPYLRTSTGTACYGIVTVPTGAWFCRKCESQERAARVHSGGRRIFSQRCELCPSKDGALKRTDSGGWAHVVCALYIPEVRFGNVTTMEPIMLQLIPQERFNKSCYICEEGGKESRAIIGACMQCNKSGCKQHFHVTCAQSMGLLCEEAGNYLDNVKYCGYCQYHFSKLRKGSHVKTIPPYRPVPLEAGASDDDKESRDTKLKRRTGRPPGVKPSGREGKLGDIIASGSTSASSSGVVERLDRGLGGEENAGVAPGSSGIALGISVNSSIVVPNKAERAAKISEPSLVNSASLSVSVTKVTAPITVSAFLSNSTSITPPSTSSSPLTPSFPTSLSSVSTSFSLAAPPTSTCTTTFPSSSTTTLSTTVSSLSSSLISSVPPILTVTPSLPRAKISEPHPHPPVTATLESPNQISLPHAQSHNQAHMPLPADADKDKEKQQERNRKLRRNGPRTPSGNSNFGDTESNVSNDEAHSSDLVLTICEEKNLSSVEKESNKVPSKPLDSSDDGGTLNVQFTPNMSTLTSKPVTDPFTPTMADFASSEPAKRGRSGSQERGRRSKRGMGKRGRPGGIRDTGGRDSGASSPDSFTSESAPAPKRGRKKADTKEGWEGTRQERKEMYYERNWSLPSVITNGVGANTLLLGNQLNPASAVAQKMTDTLHAELEAHSIYKDEDKIVSSLVGPVLPGKKENTGGNNSNGSNQPPPFPQSLEQLLERQWEQGSQFLMEQAQHFDIASLLSCLHQLRQENVRLEETVSSLISRRDHLLAVNARLSVPLSSPTPANAVSSPGGPNPPPPPSISSSLSSSSSSSAPAHTTSVPTHAVNPRPSSRGSAPAPPPPRPHSQGHHPAAGSSHVTGPTPVGAGGAGHRGGGASPHDRRGPSPQDRRGTSPHDRRAPPPPIPIENGLGEPEYRYRSPGTEHRQQSPMLPPGAQPSPTSLRHSPASSNYHPSVSPHGVGSPSPSGVPHGHQPTSHGPPPPPPPTHAPPPHSMASTHGSSSHAPPGQGPPHGPVSHGSPHGPPPHGPPPPMVSVAHSSTHSVAISRPSDHRGELVRLHTGPPPPPPPQHPGPNIGPGGYSVYQMVSPPVPGPHHSPVPPMNQPHPPPPPHAQVMRRDLVESGRGAPGPLEKR